MTNTPRTDDKSQAEREAEVAELIKRAQDPDDPYTGHHDDKAGN